METHKQGRLAWHWILVSLPQWCVWAREPPWCASAADSAVVRWCHWDSVGCDAETGSGVPSGGRQEDVHQLTYLKKSDIHQETEWEHWTHTHTRTQGCNDSCSCLLVDSDLLVAGDVAGRIIAQDEVALMKVSWSGPLGFVLTVRPMVVKLLVPLISKAHQHLSRGFLLFLLCEPEGGARNVNKKKKRFIT